MEESEGDAAEDVDVSEDDGQDHVETAPGAKATPQTMVDDEEFFI